jgi:hypothetical protein
VLVSHVREAAQHKAGLVALGVSSRR